MSMIMITIGLFGCSDPTVLSGKVLDIWDNPIEGVSVYVDGITEPQVSQDGGEFSFVLEEMTSQTIRLRTESNTHIKDVASIEYSTEDEENPVVDFRLYPKPDQKGFYGIGEKAYLPLEEQKVYTEGTKLEVFNGINNIGSVVLNTSRKQPFLFYSKLIKEEIQEAFGMVVASLHTRYHSYRILPPPSPARS